MPLYHAEIQPDFGALNAAIDKIERMREETIGEIIARIPAYIFDG